MRYFPLILFLCWIGTGCVTSRIRIEGKNLARYVKQSGVLGKSFSGFMLYDPEKKKIIHNFNGHRFFTPASNTKILTFYTAKNILGDSIPSLAYSRRKDTLYFTGQGDPTFLHPDFEYQPGLQFLAREPRILVYCPNFYSEKRYGPGWAWDDFPYDYSAEKSTFPLYGNMIRIRKLPKNPVLQISPERMTGQVNVMEDTAGLLAPGEFVISREEYANRFHLFYHSPIDSMDVSMPFITNDTLVQNLLEDNLKKEIIIREHFPAATKKILYSQPADSLLKPMMVKSDNFFAEQLLMMSSSVLFDTLSVEKAIDFARLNFYADLVDEMHWVDGSGLSRYNLVTPYTLTRVLDRIYSEMGRDYLTDIFPEAGVSGTMKENFPELKGFVYAKTGSMSHVYNLSGFLITRNGRWLIFSFMNNNFNCQPAEIREEMTKILLSVRNGQK
jgi:D-alanyl-D-alanine carboxypeptidase/D-alanyl-D-alanine-endopeptidase (penicillin-binding protein 4)